jgi:hypothetical protein
MVALGGRGDIAPTHSWPRHYMGVSGQRHVPTALCPGERTPGTHYTGGWVGPRAGLDTEVRGKILCLCRGSNPVRPVVQSVARHYTAWDAPAPPGHKHQVCILVTISEIEIWAMPPSVRFYVLKAAYMKKTVFWYMAPCRSRSTFQRCVLHPT